MKFCPVVPEIYRGQVHGPRKERRKRIRIRIRIIIIKIKIIIRNGAKTISLPNFVVFAKSYLLFLPFTETLVTKFVKRYQLCVLCNIIR